MSWRIVEITSRAKLDLKLNYLIVRRENDIKKIFIPEISILIIESTAVSVTAALLADLAKRNVKVIFCDEKRNPLFENIQYYGCHDNSIKIKNQIIWDNKIKGDVWQNIIKEKIKKQRDVLKFFKKEDFLKLEEILKNVSFFDETNKEAVAARIYFSALFGKDFSRKQESSINACLNYGYSILLSCFNREIVAGGYLTQIGIFHKNQFNFFNLSSDLMEPFRPLVDFLVYKMNPTKIDREEKESLVNILNQKVIISKETQYLNNAIRIYCKSIFDALEERNLFLVKNYEWDTDL